MQAKLLSALTDGVQDDDGTYKVVGMCDSDFSKYPVHEETLIRYVRGWLKQHRFVFAGCEDEAAATIVDLAKQALGLTPIKLDVFEKLQELREEEMQTELTAQLNNAPALPECQTKRRKRGPIDLMAVPDDETAEDHVLNRPFVRKQTMEKDAPVQLAMF